MTATADKKPLLNRDERFVDDAFAMEVLPRRSIDAHKWGVGGLVIVAGGPTYIGAAALCAMAAGRAGAGIVNVAVSRGAMGAIAALVPEVAFIPLSEGDLDSSSRRAHDAIAAKLERSRAAVVGPGLGDDDYVDGLLRTLFGRAGTRRRAGFGFGPVASDRSAAEGDAPLLGEALPTVIDADGLNWLSKQGEWWIGLRPRSLVLTPHVGEMSKLTGRSSEEILADPRGIAKRYANDWGQIVVLKGGYTVASDGTATLVATDAPTSLASAGTGDVLAGTIGAFLAQGVGPLEAAGLAIYLGSRAARRVEDRFGVLGLVASDLPVALAEEIAIIERKRDHVHG